MALTALIIDDEQLARAELRYLLERAGGVEIVAEGANGIDAVELIRAHKPEVVFLDVQMPGLDGFAVIKKLLEKDKHIQLPQIIFATAFDQYAVRAFEVNAVDYLLKPFDLARLRQTLEKTQQRVTEQQANANGGADANGAKLDALMKLLEDRNGAAQQRRGAGKIVLRAQNRLLLMDQSEICYASIEDGTINVATQTLEGTSNCRTLEELMEQLDGTSFWRAHRSHVVNIQHIREVVPWFKSSYLLRMDDHAKKEIPVSRSQTKRLRELFNL
jgi:DNA-binding LytR/AlgR family response regulator